MVIEVDNVSLMGALCRHITILGSSACNADQGGAIFLLSYPFSPTRNF